MKWLPLILFVTLLRGFGVRSAEWPALPARSGSVLIPVQEWTFQPGPRSVVVHLRYPGSELGHVKPTTGLMLSLHNWGGTAFVGTADPDWLAREFEVVAIGVDYLQSGAVAALEGPPYDFGYLQALDCLRALHYVITALERRGVAFDSKRLYATGGSGGGNVALMANKLAPRTFAGVIDLCGMKRLSDDLAFDLPGGSPLNARYRRDPASPYYLPPDRQELHFLGHPGHLRVMRTLGGTAKVISVHGQDDTVCPFADAREFAANARAAGLDLETWHLNAELLDGKVFTDTGHALGDRSLIVGRVAGHYLRPGAPAALRRAGPTDFERREVIRYPTVKGAYALDYREGFPVGRFEPRPE
jgi:predicted esterase